MLHTAQAHPLGWFPKEIVDFISAEIVILPKPLTALNSHFISMTRTIVFFSCLLQDTVGIFKTKTEAKIILTNMLPISNAESV